MRSHARRVTPVRAANPAARQSGGSEPTGKGGQR